MAFTLTNPFNVTDAGALALDGAWRATTAVVGGTTYLFVTGSLDDGVSVFSVAANGALTNVFNVTDAGALQLDDAEGVATAVVGGTTYLFATGFQDNGVSVFSVAANGALTSVFDVTDAGAFELDGAREVTTAVVGGTTYLFVTGANDDGVSVFSVAANGALTNVFNVTDDLALNLNQAEGVTTAVVGGTTYLFVAGVADDGVTVFSVAANGALTFASNVNDNVTLELDGAQDVTTAVVGGTTYLFVTGRVDDGVSVFSVAANGALTNVFNVTDDATLELDSSMGMTTATFGGTTYLFVTGFDDDGMSVFSVAANGTLTNVANSTDDATLELDGALGVTSAAVDGHTHVFVAGQVDDGVSVFSVPDLDVTQATVLHTDNDVGGPDGVIDPGDVVRTTVTITNNNTTTDATGVSFAETLVGMTLFDQSGNDVNVSPLAFDDAYTAVGNTLLEVGNAITQSAPQSNVAGSVIANDVEFLGDTFLISAFDTASTNGGTISMVTSGVDAGSFTYISAADFTGTDTFTYTIRDKGLDGIASNADDLISVGTVTITVANQVWYVDNSVANPGGDGTSTNPFDSLADVSGASGPDTDGDFIYINTGTGDYTGGITLLNNQKLVGEGSALEVGIYTGVNALAAAGADPTIVNAAGSGVTLASGNTLTGFTVGNTTGFDITNTLTASAGALTISDVTLNGSGGLIQLESGATGASIQLNSATTTAAGTDGINLANVDNSTFTVTGVTTINDASSDGIAIINSQNSTFTFTGKTTILNDGGANGDGVDLQNNNTVDSTFNFNGGVDITVNGTDAFGFRAQSSGTVNILAADGNNQITSNNGTAIFINPTVFQASLASVTAGDGGTGDGIHLEGVSGTGVTIGTVSLNGMAGDGIDISSSSANIAINGGSIGNTNDPAGIGVDIAGGSGNITINATINKTTSGDVVEVTGRTAGTVDFNAAITSSVAGGGGIDINGNTGGTVRFDGGMNLSTGTAAAFNSTGNTGMTLVVTDNNVLTTTTGTALNVANTTIGAEDLTFLSISSNGAANGIILNTTGALGGLTVTGDAGSAVNASGGTINNSTGVGISLTSTRDVVLDQMTISNGDNDGINGSSVTNFSLTNSTVSGNGDAVGEDGIVFANVLGTAVIDNTIVRNSFSDNLEIINTSGTLDVLNIKNSTFDHTAIPSSPAGGNGVVITMQGTSVMTDGSISNSTFRNNFSNGILVNTENTSRIGDDNATSGSTNGFVVSGSTFDDNNIAIQFGVFHTSDLTVDIQNNSIINDNRTATSGPNSTSSQVIVATSAGAGAGSTLNARIESNTIGNAAIDGSGSSTGNAIRAFVQGEVDATILINNNTIREAPVGYGIEYKSIGSATTGLSIPTHDITITNNNVDHTNLGFNPGTSDFPLPAISVQGDNAGSGGIVIADVAGNTVPAGTSFEFTGAFLELFEYDNGPPSADGDLRLLDRAPTGAANATAELIANNPLAGSAAASAGVSLTLTTPNLPPNLTPLPLLAAEGGVEAAAPADTTPVADTTPPADTAPPADAAPQDTASGPGDQTPATPPAPPASPAVAAHAVIVDDGTLSQSELDYFVDAALARWTASGLTDAQVAAINALTFSVGEMDGLTLGSFAPGLITFDSDAAGSGWFLDGTPLDDAEFGNVLSATRMWTDPTGAAAGHFDLLTTVMHEMGHALGLGDSYAAADREDLMYGWLFTGERRLADAGEADGAVAGSITSEEFIGAPIVIPTLPFGKTVTIQWDATIDAQNNQLIVNPVNTGTVTANAPFPASTSSNTVTTTLDTLILGGTIWNDNGAGGGIAGNGIQAGTEPGVDGVLLSLFVDANNNDVPDSPGSPIASTTTAGGGVYSFTGLAPGNYIVRVDQDNFDAGGNVSLFTPGLLVSPTTVPEPPDPDDGDPDVDNDDNGSRAAGQPAFSKTITLSYNNEPTGPVTGNDTNTTLDFGFLANIPPTANNVGPFTGNEDSTTPPRIAINLSGTDPDAGDSIVNFIIQSLPTNGQLFDDPTAGNLLGIGSTVPATGNAATVYFQPNANFNGATSFTYAANDGDQTGANATASITVSEVNDAPAGADNALVVAEDGTHTFTAAEFGFTDPTDAPTAGGADVFQDVVITTLPTAGTLTLSGNPVLAPQTIAVGDIPNLVYTPVGNANGTPYATFTFQVVDNGGMLNGGVNIDQSPNTITFNVTAVNDAPALDNTDTPVLDAVNEDAGAPGVGSGTLISALVDLNPPPGGGLDNVTDVDTTPVTGIALTGVNTANGTWFYTINGGTNWFNVGAVTDDSARLLAADANTRLYFQPTTLDFNGPVANAITFRAWDQTSGSNGVLADSTPAGTPTAFSTASDTADITVTAVNDRPELQGVNATPTYNENAGPTVLDNTLTVFDIDDTNFEFATVTISGGFVAGDILDTDETGTGISVVYDGINGVLTLSGPDNFPNFQEVLKLVTFHSTSEDPTNGGASTSRTISWVINDGTDSNSPVPTLNLTVIASNDGPTSTVPATIAVTEDVATALTGISFADPDSNTNPVVATLTVPSGTLAAVSGGGVTVGGTSSAMTLTGTRTAINAFIAAASVTFTTALNSTANVALTVDINDGGFTGGGALTDSDGATLTVTAVNDTPVNTAPAGPLAVNEDTDLAITGLQIADVDAAAGVVTTTLSVLSGTLTVASAGGAAVGGSGTTTVTLTGTVAQINTTLAAAGNVIYRGNLNFAGGDTVTMTTDDGGNTGADPGLTPGATSESDTDSFGINVTAVNDTPVNGVPASIAVTEDVATALTGIVFTDPDAGGGAVTATFSVPSGSLNAVSGGVTAGGSSSARTLSGTIANINAFIAGSNLTFTTALNATANVNLTVTLNDGGNTGIDPLLTGNGTSEEDTDVVTLAVAAVNDQPLFAGLDNTPTFIENGTSVVLDNNATVSDVELNAAGNYAGATLSLQRSGTANPDDTFGSTGTLDLVDSNGSGENVSLDGGATFIGTHSNPGDGTFSVTFNSTATAADVASVMQQIIYSNTNENPPANVQIAYTFNDGNGEPGGQPQGTGAAGIGNGIVTVTITPVNDPPFVLNANPAAAYQPGSPGVILSSGLQAGDVDNANLAGATIKIASGFFAGDELFVNLPPDADGPFILDQGTVDEVTTNITVQSNAAGEFVLTGTDSSLHYQRVLDAVSYRSTAADPSNGGANPQRTITWLVTDGGLDNTAPSAPFLPETILSFNVAPLVDLDADGAGTGFTTTFTENGAAIPIVDTDVSIVDPDNAALPFATVVLTNAKDGDVLSIAGPLPGGIDGSIDTSVAGQITVNLSNSASLADYQTALGQIRFSNASENPDPTDRDITVATTDGQFNSNVAHATIHVVRVNDAPVVNANGGSLAYTENQAATAIDPLLTILDVDNATLTGATVSIIDSGGNLHPGQDVLGFVNQNGITGTYVAATGVLTLSGTASVVNYQAALRSVTYFNSNEDPSNNTRTISYRVNDGAGVNNLSNVATADVTVQRVNDAPINTLPGAQSIDEDTNLAIAGISVADIDAGPNDLPVRTTLSVLHGTLTVASAGGATVTDSGSATVVLDGTAAQINTTLSATGNLIYRGLQDFNGADTLTVTTSDLGNRGSGGVKTDTDAVAITVNAINDTPVITSNGGGDTAAISMQENIAAVTTVTASDPDAGTTLAFSLAGGADASRFQINATTGALSFVTAPNFEGPADADHNNSYVVQVRVSDGALDDLQTITVTVTDAALEPSTQGDDFNGDARSDILWQNIDGTPAVWLLDGVNVLTAGPTLPNPNAGAPIPANQGGGAGPWREIGSSDFNGDGKADILWQNVADGRPAVWLMDGVNVLATGPALSNPGGPAWHAMEAADFNGDGKADILWQNDNGAPSVWLMDGMNVLSTGPVLPNPGPSWHTKAAADFNGDGKADILWQNDSGAASVWLMDGVNVLATGPVLPNPGASWDALAAADFNGDGNADILWQNADGTPSVWLMDGVNVLATGPLLSNPGPSWHAKEAIDANGDGKADILWQNDNGTPSVWLMDGVNVQQFGPTLFNPGASWHII